MRIYGASDDLFEIEAGDHGDEVGCYDRAAWCRIGSVDTGGLLVIGDYAPGETGTWRLSVEPLDEDVPCPWPVRVEFSGYSPIVIVDCPDDTPFVFGTGVPDLDAARVKRENEAAAKREREERERAEAFEREQYRRLHAKYGKKV